MKTHRKDVTFKNILKAFEKKLEKLKNEHENESNKEVKEILERKIQTMKKKILDLKDNKTYNPFENNYKKKM
jgi:hypothetical protein